MVQVQLRVVLGNAWNPLMGSPTGHYLLDLSIEADQVLSWLLFVGQHVIPFSTLAPHPVDMAP